MLHPLLNQGQHLESPSGITFLNTGILPDHPLMAGAVHTISKSRKTSDSGPGSQKPTGKHSKTPQKRQMEPFL